MSDVRIPAGQLQAVLKSMLEELPVDDDEALVEYLEEADFLCGTIGHLARRHLLVPSPPLDVQLSGGKRRTEMVRARQHGGEEMLVPVERRVNPTITISMCAPPQLVDNQWSQSPPVDASFKSASQLPPGLQDTLQTRLSEWIEWLEVVKEQGLPPNLQT